MFRVVFTAKCERELKKQVKSRIIKQDDLIVIRDWVFEMQNLGPQYIRDCNYWNDHDLIGERQGQRASSFSFSGRIIYKIEEKKVVVKVLKITSTHKY